MGLALRCCAALLLLATSAIAEAVTYASIEAQHAATAATLQPSPDAGRALGQIGVARVDGVVDASRCDALRTRIYDLLATLDDDDGPRDMRFVAGTRLRPYQKQSIAFMKQVERSTDGELEGLNHALNKPVRGGWLADEVIDLHRRRITASGPPTA